MRELIVDSFAGGGGTSLGIAWAVGRGPDIALNHDLWALIMHAVNHPGTRHINKNIWQADPIEVTGGQSVGLGWFSPSCTHFSNAKGGKPLDRGIRDLAWVVVLWARRVRPRVIFLENIREWLSWGPLLGNRPDPKRRGETFKRWVGELRRLGYRVEWRELRACDYGSPTTRTRLFLVARCDGGPIVWPEPTHGSPEECSLRVGAAPRLLPWRTARDCIDLNDIGEPIDGRGLAAKTMSRISHGRQASWDDPQFITKYYGSGGWQSLDEPLHTITTVDRFGLVSLRDGREHLRMLKPRELFTAQGFPRTYDITSGPDGRRMPRAVQIRMCGNSVCPDMAEALVRANYTEAEIQTPVRRVRPAAAMPLFEIGDAA